MSTDSQQSYGKMLIKEKRCVYENLKLFAKTHDFYQILGTSNLQLYLRKINFQQDNSTAHQNKYNNW